ncbi:protein-disulfide reductase DsbD N-terminal domain-containing protein, partial [Candidatus Marinimicrobia bacterium]|nr:protein-disulfide reductase DsbD N-terminal domain-containing protein [Candidatus Neomarinimicrobiota bacterium]
MRFIFLVSTFFNVILAQSDPVSFSSNIGSVARAGEVVNIEILASMEDQWHIYSVHKITEGPLPTEISISGDIIGSIGLIAEPEPKYVFDPGFDSETYYHEGNTK